MKATLQQAAVNNAKRLNNGSNNCFFAITKKWIFYRHGHDQMFFPHGAIANLASASPTRTIQYPMGNGIIGIGAIESVYFDLPIINWWPFPSVIQPRAVYNSGAQQQILFFFRNENILFRVHYLNNGERKENKIPTTVLSWPRSLSLSPSMDRREMMITLSHHHHHNVVWWLFTIITLLK